MPNRQSGVYIQQIKDVGVWVHAEGKLIVTFAEGDVSIVYCLTTEAFKDELCNMAKFYGEPPPAFKIYDLEMGSKTLVYNKRPE